MSWYITAEGQAAIKAFKYKGGDLALSYKYLWSPIADYILKLVPESWAPNAITVTGLLLHVIPTIILALQQPFGSDAPAWSLWLYGAGVCVYQMLDNVDGKQARRLQNSTPLGMIMDHGCDALGLVCLTVGMSRIICLDNFNLMLYVFTFGVTFSFYVSAWCQYYSDGIMILSKVNAVDDGIPIIWISACIAAVFGQAFWRTQVTIMGDVYTYSEVLAITIALSGVIQAYFLKATAGNNFTKEVGKALFDLIHLVIIGASVFIITNYSTLVQDYTAAIFIGLGFTMARTISYTLLCSVTNSKFKQFHPSVLLFGLGYPAFIFLGGNTFTCWVVYAMTAFMVIEYFWFVSTACRHIAKTLNIRIFHVFDPKKMTKTQ